MLDVAENKPLKKSFLSESRNAGRCDVIGPSIRQLHGASADDFRKNPRIRSGIQLRLFFFKNRNIDDIKESFKNSGKNAVITVTSSCHLSS